MGPPERDLPYVAGAEDEGKREKSQGRRPLGARKYRETHCPLKLPWEGSADMVLAHEALFRLLNHRIA